MGCGSSKPSNQNQAEAERYQRRKKNNFRDSGLERHRQACVNQKKHLHHVEDPDSARKKKVTTIQQTNRKEEKQGPLGLNENALKAERSKLKHVR